MQTLLRTWSRASWTHTPRTPGSRRPNSLSPQGTVSPTRNGAVERAHCRVRLIPNADVLKLRVVGVTRCQHFSHVTPIHADLVDRAIGRILTKRGIYAGKEGRELTFAHFPGCHRECTVLDTTQPGYVAINLYVVRRVGKNELSLVVAH